MARRKSMADLFDEGQPRVATDVAQDPAAVRLPVDRCAVNPHNPRDEDGSLEDLRSIAKRQLQSCLGVTLQAYLALWPEDVDRDDLQRVDHVIVNGNRRLKAARKYGRSDLIAIIDDTVATSRAELLRAALDENEERRNLDPIEEAKAIRGIVSEYPSARAAAQEQGWSTSYVSQRTRLLLLAEEIQQEIRIHARTEGKDGISLRDARWLAGREGIEGLSAAQQYTALEQRHAELRASKERERAEGDARHTVNDAPDFSAPSAPRPGAVQASEAAVCTAVHTAGGAEGKHADADGGMRSVVATDVDPASGAVCTAVHTAGGADGEHTEADGGVPSLVATGVLTPASEADDETPSPVHVPAARESERTDGIRLAKPTLLAAQIREEYSPRELTQLVELLRV
ncbi:ParB/RepB/Spo0J family partition protein [Streptacidiphilus sp. EB129]|uniref:ParB/RepB/Spo0J family partition protein n=1 Tax=Streptacidiphilus sp. EB129 TaxID=3156262 RepID=UPI00351452C2